METSALAARFQDEERNKSRKQSIKESRWALAWCLYSFFICIMWGFDGLAGSIIISIATFREHFGNLYRGQYVVDANWQLGWLAASLGGMVLGGWAAGLSIDRVGRRPVLLAAYLISIGGIFGQFFAETPAEFLAGKLLTGIPLGIFTTVAPTYASEMAPLNIRGSVTAGMNFAIVLGQLIGYGVMRQASLYPDDRQFRVVIAAQWGFVGAALVVLPFFPESPYWLVAHGLENKARQTLEKLYDRDHDVEGHLAAIRGSLFKDVRDGRSQGRITECFDKDNLKRTLVGSGMFLVQNASGAIWVIGYMSYFLQLAGMSASQSFDATVGLCGMMVVGNVFGWFCVDWFGRRATALWGALVLSLALLLIGILAMVSAPGILWGVVGMMAVWSFVYQATLGAAAWPITTENATSRLRVPTQAVATMTNGLSSAACAMFLPYAINPDQGNLGGRIAFIFGGALVVGAVFIFLMVPETKGRTYTEIDELWSRGVPPRKFKGMALITASTEPSSLR
ncbi:general substrate transporter [Stachybotrys elegans]|uniref:General substrate transporter n=1 Tax=Stachybotrys elegans TaxID=80388 RepID=A0A8K0WUQ9_9HYPO|nr:general substrate transporter [Stachybotrys elegans]